uniref:Phospholipid/glycerol acyltransferase domain-containing protein n=1 Tax=Paulinella longichromatophora TaxID=1708747 RepID=A0A2H4ZQ62_9EUKA|nr:hypothetical protein PLO_710 [Paulinella longichromatophora]
MYSIMKTINKNRLNSQINPYLAPIAILLIQDLLLRRYFDEPQILGKDHLPSSGATILAPVHRARWDSLLLSYYAGRRVTGRDCRFMVTQNQMRGIQGWFLSQLGCFSINQSRPSLTSIRSAIDLLYAHEQLVMFPEGRICRIDKSIKIYNGVTRLALRAHRGGVPVKIVPIGISYSHPFPLPHDKVAICFGTPINVTNKGYNDIDRLNNELIASLHCAELVARLAIGRPCSKK